MSVTAGERASLPFSDSPRPAFASLGITDPANTVVVGLLVIVLIASVLSPAVGAFVIKLGFPVLAAWLFARQTSDRLDPSLSFPAICLVWWWLGSISILPGNQEASILNDFDDRQWGLYLLSFAALWLGTLVIRGESTAVAGLRGLRVRWREGTALIVFLYLMGMLLIAWASITVSEGIPIFSADVETLRVDLPTRHRIAYQLLVSLADLLLPLIFLYLWTAPRPKLKKTLYGCSCFIAFVLVSQGNRGLVLPSLLTVFAMRHYLGRPWKAKHLLLAGLVVIPAVSISGYFRSLQHFGPSYALGLANMGFPLPLQPFSNIYLYLRAPLDTFRNVLLLMPETTPYQHGSLTFGFILQVLPGRHPSSDFFFKSLLGHTFEGFGEPASILGTFYADFGVMGIAVGMFLTGLLSRIVYLRMFTGSVAWVLIYCFFWQKLVGSLYGSLFTYAIELALPIAWLVIVYMLTGKVVLNQTREAR